MKYLRALALLGFAGLAVRHSDAASPVQGPSDPARLLPSPRSSAANTEKPVRIAFAGDVNLGRGLGQRLLRDPDHNPFSEVESLWSEADLRFANLESVLSDLHGETESKTKLLVFAGPPAGAATLARARIDVVSTANNHAWDYGKRALLETISLLDAAGVAQAGSGTSRFAAEKPWTVTVRGTKVAFLAVTGVWNQGFLEEHAARDHVAGGSPRNIRALIAKARENHDLVILSYHGGEEYTDVPVEYVERAARAAIDAGADAFIGHHPHVPEGIHFLNGKPVLYSLGNFVFAKVKLSPWSNLGLIAKLDFAPGALTNVLLCPLTIGSYAPSPLARQTRRQVSESLAHLTRISKRYGTRFSASLDEQGCFRVFPP